MEQNELNTYEAPPAHFEPPLPHSGLGIGSLVVGLLSGLVEFAAVVWSAMLVQERPDGEPSQQMVVAGLILFGGIFLAMIGAGLGLAGLFEKKNKTFPIIGLLINAAVLVMIVGLMVIGALLG